MSQIQLTIYKVTEILDGASVLLILIVFLIGGLLCRDCIIKGRARDGWIVAAAWGLLVLYGMKILPDSLIYIPFQPKGILDRSLTSEDTQVLLILELVNGIARSVVYAAAWGLILYAAFRPASKSSQSAIQANP